MDAPCSPRRAIAGLLLAALCLAPPASAHQDAPIGLEAREGERCLDGEVCLELVALPPDLEPGHETTLELRVHANASQGYTAALTTLAEADPDREATPASAALATTPSVDPGQTARVALTAPDASHAYVWLTDADQEAQGGWETFPLGMQGTQGTDADRSTPGVGATAAIVAALSAFIARRRRPT